MHSRTGSTAIGTNMNGNKLRKRAGWLLTALVLSAVLVYGLWRCWLNGAFLPRWIRWETCRLQDQWDECEILLSRRKVTVVRKGCSIWTSPEDIQVQNILIFDADNDGEDEMLLLCWKIGRYGRHRPFWVEEDEQKWSQHIFLYEYSQGQISPKWMSSYIGSHVWDMASNDRPAPCTRLVLTDPQGKETCWRWNSWGFTQE